MSAANKETKPSGEPGPITLDDSPAVPIKMYPMEEVSMHNKPDDIWLVIDNNVYDVTTFQHEHPGGAKIMSSVAGRDATKKFDKYHRRALLVQHNRTLRVGLLDLHAPKAAPSQRRSWWGKFGIGKGRV